jgi:hypothetical protein
MTACLTPEQFTQMHADLHWLETHHALAGIAEVVRERRRQIEQKGYTVAHDQRVHADGALAQMAAGALSALADQRLEGLADPATDQGALAESAALAAAEIDRLTEFEPEPAAYRCWTVDGATHHVHGPGQPCPLRLP